MIVFNDILKKLSDKGYSTYRLQKEKRISNGTIIRIRNKESISTSTIDTLCELLDCQPGDLMKYVPDNKQG